MRTACAHCLNLFYHFFCLRISNAISFWTNSITNDILTIRKFIAILFLNDLFMFPFSISRLIPFSYGFYALFFGACADEDRISTESSVGFSEIRAEVLSIDRNVSRITAVPQTIGRQVLGFSELDLGKSIEFQVEPGDFGYLSPGKVFRSKVVQVSGSDSQILSLSSIWPDDPSYRIRFENVNRMLRRDTLSRGDDPIRTIGEYLPPFALFDQDGNLLTTDFFYGKSTVLNFIFTRCSVPEMCPAATNRMRRLQNLVFANNLSEVQFLSITLDPEHDVPGVLKTYALAYGIDESNFRFATGPKSVIDDLVRQFGISRKRDDPATLDHTMRTLVVNSRRQVVYQVPGKGWSEDDFLTRLKGGSSNEKY
jgi:protein SCO1